MSSGNLKRKESSKTIEGISSLISPPDRAKIHGGHQKISRPKNQNKSPVKEETTVLLTSSKKSPVEKETTVLSTPLSLRSESGTLATNIKARDSKSPMQEGTSASCISDRTYDTQDVISPPNSENPEQAPAGKKWMHCGPNMTLAPTIHSSMIPGSPGFGASDTQREEPSKPIKEKIISPGIPTTGLPEIQCEEPSESIKAKGSSVSSQFRTTGARHDGHRDRENSLPRTGATAKISSSSLSQLKCPTSEETTVLSTLSKKPPVEKETTVLSTLSPLNRENTTLERSDEETQASKSSVHRKIDVCCTHNHAHVTHDRPLSENSSEVTGLMLIAEKPTVSIKRSQPPVSFDPH
jgi:hypothetical protein